MTIEVSNELGSDKFELHVRGRVIHINKPEALQIIQHLTTAVKASEMDKVVQAQIKRLTEVYAHG